ncbi:MAG: hypothetical protein DRO36_01835 [Candidatus Hecatellales archaeon]|nr:MAG: hypothetical protein DRO36_01835 [Candidatus Hecatellales archaeon]
MFKNKKPILAASALVKRNGKVLLVRRRYEPGSGRWALPGGMVEYGETVEETAKREVKEETNVDVEVEKLLGVYNLILRDEYGRVKRQYVIVCFEGVGKTFKLKPNHEVLDLGWFKPEELDKLQLVTTTRMALRDAGFLREK